MMTPDYLGFNGITLKTLMLDAGLVLKINYPLIMLRLKALYRKAVGAGRWIQLLLIFWCVLMQAACWG